MSAMHCCLPSSPFWDIPHYALCLPLFLHGMDHVVLAVSLPLGGLHCHYLLPAFFPTCLPCACCTLPVILTCLYAFMPVVLLHTRHPHPCTHGDTIFFCYWFPFYHKTFSITYLLLAGIRHALPQLCTYMEEHSHPLQLQVSSVPFPTACPFFPFPPRPFPCISVLLLYIPHGLLLPPIPYLLWPVLCVYLVLLSLTHHTPFYLPFACDAVSFLYASLLGCLLYTFCLCLACHHPFTHALPSSY